MRKFFALLFYCFAGAVLACDETDGDSAEQWFRQPEVTVDGTSADVVCLTFFGHGVLASSSCGFVCQPVSSASSGAGFTVSDPVIEDSMLKCRLTSLAPETNYLIYPFVEAGSQRLTGKPAVFRSGTAPENPAPENPDPENPDPENPDPENPDPEEPDPDTPTPPRPGAYTGWPELPQTEERPGDLYYATHICPAFTTASGVFENNLRSYTVCYSHDMMSALWSAYPLHASYKGDSDRSNAWAYDPIIPRAVQPALTSGSYKPQTPGYSRGHLLASNDRTANEEMNKQTFYVTNMAPQKQTNFNDGIWSTLEKNTWNNICADTLFVVSGVWYANTDETVMDNADPKNTVYVPTNFYKVMIRSKSGNTGKPLCELSADEMQCIAFWFENKSYPGASLSTFRTTVADVEQKTGMTFFVNVPDAPKDSSAGSWSF